MIPVSLQSIVNTSTFKDFDIPNSVLCRSLKPHTHKGISNGGALLNINMQNDKEISAPAPSFDAPSSDFSEEKNEKNGFIKKFLPLTGAVLGTVLSVVILNKIKGKNINAEVLRNGKMIEKLKEAGEYFEIEDIKGILATAGGAIAGGLFGGFVSDKDKENRKEKVKNAVFEMVNISIPALLVVGMGKFFDSAKNLKMNPALKKVLPIALGIGLGAPAASKISGAVNKKMFKEDESKQRHFRPKDYIVHIDDIMTAFAVSNIPFLKAIPFDKILALIFIHCGYEAGCADKKGHSHHHG